VEISRRRRLLAMCLTVGIVLLLTLLALELGVRAFVPVTDVYSYFYDPLLGPRIGPNQTGRMLRGRYIDARYRFNNQGWNHADDYQVARPPGTRRIALIGDSQVESLQVDYDRTLYAGAEREMSRPDRPVQWYAFGNSGWGTNLHHEVLRHYVLDYEPDVVVLLFLQNDPYDSSPYLVSLPDYRPWFALDGRGGADLFLPAPHFQQRPRIGSRSALYRYLMHQRRLHDRWVARGMTRRLYIGGLPLLAEGEGASQEGLIPGLAELTPDERGEKTWALTEVLLRQMRDESRRRGATFAIAFRGWTFEIEEPLTGVPFVVAPREKDVYCLGERASEMGREQVAPIAARLGIPYLDLTDALRAEVIRTGQSHVFPDDNHFNATAHEAAGRALAAWTARLLPATAAKR